MRSIKKLSYEIVRNADSRASLSITARAVIYSKFIIPFKAVIANGEAGGGAHSYCMDFCPRIGSTLDSFHDRCINLHF